MAYTSLLFINDVKPLFFVPHPTLPHSPRCEERRWDSGGIKSLLEKDTKKYQSSPLTLLSSEEESLSPPGRFGSECAHTLTSTIMRRSLTFTHTFTLAHRPTRSQAHAHNGEEGWLSSESTLQAAACLGKPDAFLPPGRNTHCHLKGSLLGPIHPQFCG